MKHILEQLELEKIIGIQKSAGKVRNKKMNRTNRSIFESIFQTSHFTNTCVNRKYFLSLWFMSYISIFIYWSKLKYILWNNDMSNCIFISLGEQSHTTRGPVQLSSRWDSRQFTNLNKLSHLLPGYMIIGYYYHALYYYCEKSPRLILLSFNKAFILRYDLYVINHWIPCSPHIGDLVFT